MRTVKDRLAVKLNEVSKPFGSPRINVVKELDVALKALDAALAGLEYEMRELSWKPAVKGRTSKNFYNPSIKEVKDAINALTTIKTIME